MRTPSRNEAGLELLMEYYNQLCFLDQRFFSPHRSLGIHFHWWDTLLNTNTWMIRDRASDGVSSQVRLADRRAFHPESAGIRERERFVQHRSTLYSDRSQTGSLDSDGRSERYRCFPESSRYWIISSWRFLWIIHSMFICSGENMSVNSESITLLISITKHLTLFQTFRLNKNV